MVSPMNPSVSVEPRYGQPYPRVLTGVGALPAPDHPVLP
jgi:hypothetical protein